MTCIVIQSLARYSLLLIIHGTTGNRTHNSPYKFNLDVTHWFVNTCTSTVQVDQFESTASKKLFLAHTNQRRFICSRSHQHSQRYSDTAARLTDLPNELFLDIAARLDKRSDEIHLFKINRLTLILKVPPFYEHIAVQYNHHHSARGPSIRLLWH